MSRASDPVYMHTLDLNALTARTRANLENAVKTVIDEATEEYTALWVTDRCEPRIGMPLPEWFRASWYQALFPQRDVDRESPRTAAEAREDWQHVGLQQAYQYQEHQCRYRKSVGHRTEK